MKKELTLALALCLFSVIAYGQFSTPADGHELKWVKDYITVYRGANGNVVLDHPKMWHHKYWFYYCNEVKGDSGIVYIKIYIPDSSATKGVVDADPTKWTKDLMEIGPGDFDTYLYLKKVGYDANVVDHIPKYTSGLVWTALTLPLKIHPAISGHPGSLYNASFNAGTFLGCRIGFLNDVVGATIGGFLDFSNLQQTSAVNSAVKEGASQDMFSVNYGAGIIFDLTKKFQLGALVGWDHGYGDLSTTYLYQRKSWFALSLNFSFLDLSKPVSGQ